MILRPKHEFWRSREGFRLFKTLAASWTLGCFLATYWLWEHSTLSFVTRVGVTAILILALPDLKALLESREEFVEAVEDDAARS